MTETGLSVRPSKSSRPDQSLVLFPTQRNSSSRNGPIGHRLSCSRAQTLTKFRRVKTYLYVKWTYSSRNPKLVRRLGIRRCSAVFTTKRMRRYANRNIDVSAMRERSFHTGDHPSDEFAGPTRSVRRPFANETGQIEQ